MPRWIQKNFTQLQRDKWLIIVYYKWRRKVWETFENRPLWNFFKDSDEYKSIFQTTEKINNHLSFNEELIRRTTIIKNKHRVEMKINRFVEELLEINE